MSGRRTATVVAPLCHCGRWRNEGSFIFVLIFVRVVCARDISRGQSGLGQKHGSMLHVRGDKPWYVRGGVAECCWGKPSVYRRSTCGWTGTFPRLFNDGFAMVPLAKLGQELVGNLQDFKTWHLLCAFQIYLLLKENSLEDTKQLEDSKQRHNFSNMTSCLFLFSLQTSLGCRNVIIARFFACLVLVWTSPMLSLLL